MRALWTFAAAVLALDGALLLWIGKSGGRPWAFVGAAGCAAAAIAVIVSWRSYRRRLDELGRARRSLAQEARDLAATIRKIGEGQS